jgi:hypothetical protein
MSREADAGATVEVPLWASFMTGTEAHGDELTLTYRMRAWDRLGRESELPAYTRSIEYSPWRSEALDPLSVKMPEEPGVAVLAVELADAGGTVLHRNFTTFVVQGESPEEVRLEGGRRARLVRVGAADYSDARWSMKQWDVLDGLKVNGAGHGFFEYRIPWPSGVTAEEVETGAFLVEASAKQLYGKDRENAGEMDDDYMRGRGTHDPSLNPNAYPMTDEETFSGAVTVRFGDVVGGTYELPDDPADHRGILSWHSQLRDRRLREAGSYGWLIDAAIPRRALEQAAENGELVVRLEVDESLPRGLAIYGEHFGRYPVDPTLKLTLRQ